MLFINFKDNFSIEIKLHITQKKKNSEKIFRCDDDEKQRHNMLGQNIHTK